MQFFVYRYELKNGEVVGYHGDSFCTITERKYAKSYPEVKAEEEKAQMQIIRRNFEAIWADHKWYQDFPFWKGSKPEDIKIVREKK